MAWRMETSQVWRSMPSWLFRTVGKQQVHEHRLAVTTCRDGGRHRLGVAAHLAGNVGEALRPGPVTNELAEDLAELLDIYDHGDTVIWPDGHSAASVRRLLKEHRCHPPAITLGGDAGSHNSNSNSSINSSSPHRDLTTGGSPPGDLPTGGSPPGDLPAGAPPLW